MAPLWQACPIHRTADVYATSRYSAAVLHAGQRWERLHSQQALIAWRQSAGSSAAGQGRSRRSRARVSASLDGLTPGRHGMPKRSRLNCPLRTDPAHKMRLPSPGRLILKAFPLQGPVWHLSSWHRTLLKINVQTKTSSPNRPQRHCRFYLALGRSTVSSSPTPRESSPKCDQTKRTGAADLCQKIPDEPAIGKNSFKHRALAPAGSLARRAALRTALQARPFPRTGASLLTGLGPHSLRSEPRP
jgi:hypothetical protein